MFVINKAWWLERRNAFLDNLIFGVFVSLAGVIGFGVVIALAAFGTRDATLPLWLVALFGLVQAGLIGAVVLLYRRVNRIPMDAGDAEPKSSPHPHAALLDRLDELERAVEDQESGYTMKWPPAETFNNLLSAARAAIGKSALEEIPEFEADSDDPDWVRTGDYGTLRLYIRQVRSIVNHAGNA